MSRIPYLAVVLEGGLVQSVIVQDWSSPLPPPRIVVVDYDIDSADEDELTHFSIGADPDVALCHSEVPERYEDCPAAPSPRAIWTALAGPDEAGGAEAREDRAKTHAEQSLSDYLAGYLRHDPDRREELRDCSDWPCLARRELDRRSARFLAALPDDLLHAIAQGEVDPAGLAGKIPD